jgi:hypothetical protein
MAIRSESNFPNSRITAQLQANDADHPGNLLNIDGQQITIGATTYKALMVQIAQVSSNPLVANCNLNQYQGLSSFNISNPFVPEAYNRIDFSSTTVTNRYAFYYNTTFIRTVVITYTDATKKVPASNFVSVDIVP